MSDLHSISRTSPKGEAFVGTCMKCGKAGLTLKDMHQECDNPSRMTQDEALIAALDPVAIPKLDNCGRYLAEDNTGQWHYLNHAGTWQTYAGPSSEFGLVGKVPTEVWLTYDKRAADYAAMHGNGSAALKSGILRLTLEAWLSGRMLAGEPSAWVVVYSDGSRGLAFTAEEADEAIAEAHVGAVREPLFAHASLPIQAGGKS